MHQGIYHQAAEDTVLDKALAQGIEWDPMPPPLNMLVSNIQMQLRLVQAELKKI